nr:E6 [Phodopus sungorus papillomavirus 1]QWC92939.1 E6 [Phodopus sungorus papillomavirus 1]QWC92945.1 E6 [Phodopus sungorus papillomavirus 1]
MIVLEEEPVTVGIKRRRSRPLFGRPMDLPIGLEELLDALKIDVKLLLLPCLFCGHLCNEQDKFDFLQSGLKVVWKNLCYHIACQACRRVAAYVEHAKCRVCVGEHDFVERMTGKCILQTTMRCIACMKELGASEKLLAVSQRRPFILVRKLWRGYCRNCFVL